MAVTIKLKNASGSDPSASDLVVGEVAIRTDNGKLFTKKDNGSVAEITGGGGIDDGDKGDITVSNSGGTFTIDNEVVTFAKMQNITHNSFLARNSSGTGDIQQLSVSDVLTMLSVESGATGDQSNSEIKTAYEANSDTNAFTDALLSKLNGIAASATNVTNNNQLTNGAGYITATLTNEQVQDIVGGMLTGNTETGITVTYQDGDGTIDFVVGTLNQDTTGNAATATALETARNIGGVSFDGTGNINLPGVNTSGNQDTSGNAATATALATARTIAGVSFDGTANISLNNNAITNGAGYITATLTNEEVQDIVGGMLTGNTETGITVTYQDGDGTIDFVVGTLNQDTTGNAATATTLETARNIAGVSFDGSANISLNNNAITNGAGYITGSSLNASNLDSGTIPDARFPATLPAVSGANLTGIAAGATGGGSDQVFYENGQNITTNYTITNGKNAMSAGPITIDSGVTVTVGSGENWTVV